MPRKTLALPVVLIVVLQSAFVRAEDYPSRQVAFVVPFAAGGGTDILGRLVAQKLTDHFGKSFVVENRPGAGTVNAAVQVAKSTPDGHTIMMATSGTMAMNPTLYKSLPYSPGKDLVLAALICDVPFVLVVNNELPVKSVADLVKLANTRPLSYGSGGVGAFHHLLGELFNRQFGTKITHVPYRGTLPALNDLVAGHIQMMFADLAPAYPQIQAGRVRALGISTKARVGSAPELGPLNEVGAPGFDWAAWQAVAVPGSIAPEIRATLNTAIDAAVSQPDVQKQLVNLQFIPVGKRSPAELDRFVASETTRWAKVLQQAGVAGTQ
jgi:tripartite-type tricarboxylate transporter receptor subunit TctC